MIPDVSPWELLKVLLLGVFFGYLIAKYRYRKPKVYQFVNLRFGDIENKKELKL